jgi:predicted nucleic-acid-binding protein
VVGAVIALDTNVIVRVLVQDDAEQTERARSLIERALADGARLFVPTIVLCETVWVLESAYGFPRSTVVEALSWLLAAEQLEFEAREEAERALGAYADGGGDVADFLLRERARTHGAGAVATFDRELLSSQGFVDPDPGTWSEDVSLHEPAPQYRSRRLSRPVLR